MAIGRKWFSRPQGRFARYAHGGISLDEMIVPGVFLEKVVIARMSLNLSCPDSMDLTEDVPAKLELKVINDGNKETDFYINSRTSTGTEESNNGHIQPGDSQTIPISFIKPSLELRNLEVTLLWGSSNKEPTKSLKRLISLKVKEKKDKVEFKFGDLDKLME